MRYQIFTYQDDLRWEWTDLEDDNLDNLYLEFVRQFGVPTIENDYNEFEELKSFRKVDFMRIESPVLACRSELFKVGWQRRSWFVIYDESPGLERRTIYDTFEVSMA